MISRFILFSILVAATLQAGAAEESSSMKRAFDRAKSATCWEELEGEYLEIETPRLILRPSKSADMEGFVRLYTIDVLSDLKGPHFVKMVFGSKVEPGYALSELERLRKGWIEKMPSNPNGTIQAFEFVIALKSNGEMIGAGSVARRPDHWNVSSALIPEYRGFGYATERMKGIIEFIRQKDPNALIKTHALKTNLKSQAVLKRSGFEKIESTDPNAIADTFLLQLQELK